MESVQSRAEKLGLEYEVWFKGNNTHCFLWRGNSKVFAGTLLGAQIYLNGYRDALGQRQLSFSNHA